MSIAEALLTEWDFETISTRKCLERAPGDQLAYKPHERSTTLGDLATHIATIPLLGEATAAQPELNFATLSLPKLGEAGCAALFDDCSARFKAALGSLSDAQLMEPWTLRAGDTVMATMPRIAALRRLTFSHIIHHRAQLAVYLRLLNIPVPSIYGPSADEQS